ncbi:hypothetical protein CAUPRSCDRAFT_12070 [Caulochytrium protostelioides]|uniref:Uncharacterized protein n=1 Tax=Caulochytrium protostelioides TaxID=1555241 RepID=A0A4P9WY57_9FUNG|nr:hypothetical protein CAUPRSCDRAFT_12070 [Caulochytrium protostelioides]
MATMARHLGLVMAMVFLLIAAMTTAMTTAAAPVAFTDDRSYPGNENNQFAFPRVQVRPAPRVSQLSQAAGGIERQQQRDFLTSKLPRYAFPAESYLLMFKDPKVADFLLKRDWLLRGLNMEMKHVWKYAVESPNSLKAHLCAFLTDVSQRSLLDPANGWYYSQYRNDGHTRRNAPEIRTALAWRSHLLSRRVRATREHAAVHGDVDSVSPDYRDVSAGHEMLTFANWDLSNVALERFMEYLVLCEALSHVASEKSLDVRKKPKLNGNIRKAAFESFKAFFEQVRSSQFELSAADFPPFYSDENLVSVSWSPSEPVENVATATSTQLPAVSLLAPETGHAGQPRSAPATDWLPHRRHLSDMLLEIVQHSSEVNLPFEAEIAGMTKLQTQYLSDEAYGAMNEAMLMEMKTAMEPENRPRRVNTEPRPAPRAAPETAPAQSVNRRMTAPASTNSGNLPSIQTFEGFRVPFSRGFQL